MGLEKLQLELNCGIQMDELQYLISISKDTIRHIIKLKYIDGLTYKEIDNMLKRKNSNMLIRNWKFKVAQIVHRLRAASCNYDDVANLDIDMQIYHYLRWRRRDEKTQSIQYISSVNDEMLLKTFRAIGDKRCKLIRESIQRYYNGRSNFGLKCIKSL